MNRNKQGKTVTGLHAILELVSASLNSALTKILKRFSFTNSHRQPKLSVRGKISNDILYETMYEKF